MIVVDKEGKRIVDQESGETLTWWLDNNEDWAKIFTIIGASGVPKFSAKVRTVGSEYIGDDFHVINYVMTEAWFPKKPYNVRELYTGETDYVCKLERFLSEYKYISGVKTPDPEFRFYDARLDGGFSL